MKLSIFFLVVVFFQMQANSGYSQRTKIDLNLLETPLSAAFDEIEASTEFKFFYKNEEINLNRKVSIQIQKARIDKILDHLFAGTSIVYKIKGKHIILKKEPIKAVIPTNKMQQEVRGIVSDQKGVPIPGVTITVKNTNTGTVTNLDGEYSINAPENATLVFSYIGFKTLEEEIDTRSTINIQFEEDITALGEVQINAGYYTTTERESTGNISRVTAEEIEQQPVVSPIQALAGRMAGVEITPNGNLPGNASTIRIRGTNSLREEGNFPLYIIDGVPINSTPLESNSNLTFGGIDPLNTLNLSNIESIEVLKDADATAIYGSRGANGVILITTKKGREGKTELQARVYTGASTVPNRIDLLNTEEYLQIRRRAFENDGVEPTAENAYDLLIWDQDRYTDWQKEFFGGTAQVTDVNLNVSGGNKNTIYSISGSYHKQGTVFFRGL